MILPSLAAADLRGLIKRAPKIAWNERKTVAMPAISIPHNA
jgi:hypothetical protein